MKFLIFSLFLLFTTGASCHSFREDTLPLSAFDGNDETIVMQGFGQKAALGLLHVRVHEESVPDGMITVIFPKLNCKLESCAEIKAIRDGNIYPIGSFKVGENEHKFPLSSLIRDDTHVLPQYDGAYRLIIEYYYETDEGEQHRKMSGRVFLSVLKKGYVPVACNSPDIAVIETVFPGCEAQFTTKGRAALCGQCKEREGLKALL